MTLLFTPFPWAPLSDEGLEKYGNYVVQGLSQIGFDEYDIQENDFGLPVVSELKVRRLLEAETRLDKLNVLNFYQIRKLVPYDQQEWHIPLSDIVGRVTMILGPEMLAVNDRNRVEIWKLRDLYELIYASNLTWMYLESVDDHMQTLQRRFDFTNSSIEIISKSLAGFNFVT